MTLLSFAAFLVSENSTAVEIRRELLSKQFGLQTATVTGATDEDLLSISGDESIGSIVIVESVVTPQIFHTLATLPRLSHVSIKDTDLSPAIDERTHNAIASMAGRLEDLQFDQWGSAPIHSSMLPAIGRLHRLKGLEIGEVVGDTTTGVNHLKTLQRLEYFEGFPEAGTALHRLLQARRRFNNPLVREYTRDPAEAEVALMYVMSRKDAISVFNKVSELRKSDPKERPQYEGSDRPVADILVQDFEVSLFSSALPLKQPDLVSPTLDTGIRRYLSGNE